MACLVASINFKPTPPRPSLGPICDTGELGAVTQAALDGRHPLAF